jgi:hypothetical protein
LPSSDRKIDKSSEVREEFLTYPQTSPEIYAWLPYHRDSSGRVNQDAPPAAEKETRSANVLKP